MIVLRYFDRMLPRKQITKTRWARAISPFALRARCVMFCLSTFSHILAPLCLFWKSDVPPAGKLALRGSTVLGPWLRFRNTLLSLFHPIIDISRAYTRANDIAAVTAMNFPRSHDFRRRFRWRHARDARSWNRHARQASMAGRSAAFIYRRPRARYTQPASSTTEHDNIGPGSLRGSSYLPIRDSAHVGYRRGHARALIHERRVLVISRVRKQGMRHALCGCAYGVRRTKDGGKRDMPPAVPLLRVERTGGSAF